MKKLLLLTILLLAFACSKDDESGETFLDKYDGTSWTVEGSGEIITFSNGTYFRQQYYGGNAFIAGNEEDTFECMQFKEGTNVIFGSEIIHTFQKNEPNEFVFDYILNGEMMGIIKIIPQGENLLWTTTSNEGEVGAVLMIKSDESYSDYCN
jgi:hypothetical protein